jgi:hypothetical protein
MRRRRARRVRSLLEEIGNSDRVILGADLAVAVVVDEELVSAGAVAPGSLAGWMNAAGLTYVQSRSEMLRKNAGASAPCAASSLYSSGKSGVSTSRRPEATSRLAAPPAIRTAPRAPCSIELVTSGPSSSS